MTVKATDSLGSIGKHFLKLLAPVAQQHRHQAAALRDADLDVREVAFQPRLRRVLQQQLRLPLPSLAGLEPAAHSVVTASIAVLITQAFEQSHRRVSARRGAKTSSVRIQSVGVAYGPSFANALDRVRM